MNVIDQILCKSMRGMRTTDLFELLVPFPVVGTIPKVIFGEKILQPFRSKGLIFIHIPKNAGTSVTHALYGESISHYTSSLYKSLNPKFYMSTPSFAIIRCPIERFLSAYSFVLNKGGEIFKLNPVWEKIYSNLSDFPISFNNFIEIQNMLSESNMWLDFVFRPQSMFVEDQDGTINVDRLFLMDVKNVGLQNYLASFNVDELPVLNKTKRIDIVPSISQINAIEKMYERDVILFDRLRSEGNCNLKIGVGAKVASC